jgi:hypothetical protein
VPLPSASHPPLQVDVGLLVRAPAILELSEKKDISFKFVETHPIQFY